jgi:glutathione S-transferase
LLEKPWVLGRLEGAGHGRELLFETSSVTRARSYMGEPAMNHPDRQGVIVPPSALEAALEQLRRAFTVAETRFGERQLLAREQVDMVAVAAAALNFFDQRETQRLGPREIAQRGKCLRF